MYVCVCKAVSDHQIEKLAREGVRDLTELRRCTGLGSVCGRCIPEARQLLNRAAAQAECSAISHDPASTPAQPLHSLAATA